MQLESFEQLEQIVFDADMVVVGLGEEWVLNEKNILDDLKEKNAKLWEIFSVAEKEKQYQKLLPFLTAYYYEKYVPENLKRAYENMLKLLEGKNYFIVSLSIDSYLKKIGFKENRYVNPCGTYEKIQCKAGCEQTLKSSEELFGKIQDWLENTLNTDRDGQSVNLLLDKGLEIFDNIHCEKCGADIGFNCLDSNKYLEEGYLEQWQFYMKWLQGTLNKKLVVIEAGAGMKLPSVIRWPFEKTVFYNQKANMVRIHQKYYQVNEEIAERSYGCKYNSVRFFGEKNLEA